MLHNTPFDAWKSVKWTPQKLKAEPRIKQILSKKGRDNVFKYFANDQPLSVHEMFKTAKPFIEVIYSRERFFDILQQPHDGYHYYSSGGIELLDIEDIYSSEDLDLLTFKSSYDRSLGQVNFWFGKENVTAYTHYDTSYNLHAIAYGRKKFIVFPPEVYHDLQLYPCLHQFYRQTQTNILDSNYSKTLTELKGLEVILSPGEVLYIPPYWFHCVVTLETTVSLNVWSQSEVFLVMEEVYSIPLPFEESWGREKLMKIFVYFLNKLAREIFNLDEDSSDIFLETVFERYSPFLNKFSDGEHQGFLSMVQSYCLATSIKEMLDTENIRNIDDRIFEITGLFRRVHPQAVREINFGNYVEHTALRILGADDIILLPFYMKQCFKAHQDISL